MSNYNFMVKAKNAIADWLYEHYEKNNKPINISWIDVAVVWMCKTLQNHKGIFVAPTPDHFMFEATWNGDKNELYLDVYDKVENICFRMDNVND